MTPGDELPWHRQFWPWFLVALLALSIAGSLVSAWLAVRYPEVILEHTDGGLPPASAPGDG
jgi:hypothetical protein